MAIGDYTQVRFFNIPSNINLLVDGSPASEGVWYANNLEVKVQKQNSDDFGSPFATLEYQTTDGTLVSERAIITVNFLVNGALTPSAVNLSDTMLNSGTEILDATALNLNDGVDRIKILTFKEIGSLTVNGGQVIPNQEILRADLSTFQYTADANGFGPEYQLITYQVGNSSGYEATIYSITLEVAGTGSVALDSSSTYNQDGSSGGIWTFLIANGYPGKIADIDITLNLSAAPLSNPANVIISTPEGSTKYQANGTQNFLMTIPEKTGQLYFTVEVDIDDAQLPENGSFTVTLNEIDSDPLLVSGSPVVVNLNLTT